MKLFASPIPGDLVAPIVLGDRAAVELELSRIPATSSLLAACARLACANGKSGVLESLLETGFQANDAEALKCAASGGWTRLLEQLRAHGAEIGPVGNELAVAAARGGHLETLQYLHAHGCSLDSCAGLVSELACKPSLRPVFDYLAANGIFPAAEPAAINGRSRMTGTLRKSEVEDPQAAQSPLPAHGATAVPIGGSSPTISLLLANYNHGIFLRTSLQAVLSQTRLPDEIIIVDDGSTDESVEVIRQFISVCPRARLLRHERNLGQHAAIQRALAEARSDYIVWASSDDLLLRRFIERAVDVLSNHPGIGLCFSQLCVWREDTEIVREFTSHGPAFDLGTEVRCYSPKELRERLRHRYLWISGNTVVARRDALVAMGGFDARLRWHADWFAFYAVALRHGACSIPEVLAMMRERDQTYSRDGMVNPKAQRAVLRAIIDVIRQPDNRDLLKIFRACPALLSPFGWPMLAANPLQPLTWPLMVTFLAWLAPRELARVFWHVISAWWRPRSARVHRTARVTLFALVRRISNKKARAYIAGMLYWYRARIREPRRKASRALLQNATEGSKHRSRYS